SVAPLTTEVCVGGTALLTATITGGSSGLTQQWQSSPDGTNGWVNIPGETSITFQAPTSSTGTTYYRIVITDLFSDCSDPVSNTVSVLVQPDATVSIAPPTTDVCIGGTAILTATITGGSSALTIQWQSSPNGLNTWSNPGSGNGTTYSAITSSAGTTYYRVMITDNFSDCSDPISNVISVIVAPDLLVTTQPTNVNECIGGTSTMTVIVSGGSGTLSYQWQSSPNGSTGWANATGTGSTTSIFTPPSDVAGTTFYRVLINASNSGCDQAVSNNATAIISPDLVVTSQPSNVNECVGGTNTMSVVVSGG